MYKKIKLFDLNNSEMEKICEQLNKLIDEKKDGFIDEVNAIITKLHEDGGDMYWDREIFIDCNGDDETMRDLVRKSNKVHFYPSDDYEEHKGVVVRYKKPKIAGKALCELCDGLKEEKIQQVYELIDSLGFIDKFFEYVNDGETEDFLVEWMKDVLTDLVEQHSILYICMDYYSDVHEVPYWMALDRVAEAMVTDIMAEKQN